MLTKEQVLNDKGNTFEFKCLDGRDRARLCGFLNIEELGLLGFELKEGGTHKTKEWTEENIKAQLDEDAKFAYEKGCDERGISSEMMHYVLCMWLWILEDDLYKRSDELYSPYGLPFVRAVAEKYNIELQY